MRPACSLCTSGKRHHSVLPVLRLALRPSPCAFETHPRYCAAQEFIPVCGWWAFHCMRHHIWLKDIGGIPSFRWFHWDWDRDLWVGHSHINVETMHKRQVSFSKNTLFFNSVYLFLSKMFKMLIRSSVLSTESYVSYFVSILTSCRETGEDIPLESSFWDWDTM